MYNGTIEKNGYIFTIANNVITFNINGNVEKWTYIGKDLTFEMAENDILIYLNNLEIEF